MLERVARGSALAGVALLAAAAVAAGIDIATRRTLQWGWPGLVDLTQWCVMVCAFACIPLTFLRQAQVEVDFVTVRWAEAVQQRLRAVAAAVGAVFMLAVALATAWAMGQSVQRGDLSPTLAWPMWRYWAAVVLGSLLASIACAHLAWTGWPRRPRP